MTKKFWLAAALIAPLALHAQQQTGSIHGHAQDPAGTPLANAQIQVSTDGKTPLYTFTRRPERRLQGRQHQTRHLRRDHVHQGSQRRQFKAGRPL